MTTSEKTTLTDLLAADSNQVNPLLANSHDELIDVGTELTTQTPPAIGQYWPGQGGYYAGIMRDGDRQWHLILAAILVETTTLESPTKTFTNGLGAHEAEWGTYGETIPGEFSRRDGQHNTALILAAEPDNEIASHFTAMLIDGHKDFYWPAQCENNLLFNNLPEHLSSEWHWSSTQCSARLAWIQNFVDGYQDFDDKYNSLAARAVRRLPI